MIPKPEIPSYPQDKTLDLSRHSAQVNAIKGNRQIYKWLYSKESKTEEYKKRKEEKKLMITEFGPENRLPGDLPIASREKAFARPSSQACWFVQQGSVLGSYAAISLPSEQSSLYRLPKDPPFEQSSSNNQRH
jgi:hypothetical protein